MKSGVRIQTHEKWNVNRHRGLMDVFELLCNWSENYSYLIFVTQQPYAGLGRLTVEVSRSQADTSFITRRTSLEEGSACRWDLYLITHDIIKRQTSLPVVIFEPTILASEWQHTYASDRRIIRIIGTIFFDKL